MCKLSCATIHTLSSVAGDLRLKDAVAVLDKALELTLAAPKPLGTRIVLCQAYGLVLHRSLPKENIPSWIVAFEGYVECWLVRSLHRLTALNKMLDHSRRPFVDKIFSLFNRPKGQVVRPLDQKLQSAVIKQKLLGEKDFLESQIRLVCKNMLFSDKNNLKKSQNIS